MNWYGYVGNNPLGFVDPTGLIAEDDVVQVHGTSTGSVIHDGVTDNYYNNDSSLYEFEEYDLDEVANLVYHYMYSNTYAYVVGDIINISTSEITAMVMQEEISSIYGTLKTQEIQQNSSDPTYDVMNSYRADGLLLKDVRVPHEEQKIDELRHFFIMYAVTGVIAGLTSIGIEKALSRIPIKANPNSTKVYYTGKGSVNTNQNTANTQKPPAVRRKLTSDPNATGDHSVFKVDPQTGKVVGYQTFKANPQNPRSGFDTVIRVDTQYAKLHIHTNKVTGADISTPHVHGKGIPGGVRPAALSELPR